jgi:hypothetical protein
MLTAEVIKHYSSFTRFWHIMAYCVLAAPAAPAVPTSSTARDLWDLVPSCLWQCTMKNSSESLFFFFKPENALKQVGTIVF